MITTYNIETVEQRQQYIEEFGLKPVCSMQRIVLQLLQRASEEDIPTVEIKIAEPLVQTSYITVPAMFIETLKEKDVYPCIQCYFDSEGGMLVIRAGQTRKPMTFRARGVKALERNGFFKVAREAIPRTYRRRPNIFREILIAALQKPVAMIAKPEFIKWKLDTKSATK